MTNIMLATDDELYRGLNEVDEILNDMYITRVQAAEMTNLKQLIETEVVLRKEGEKMLIKARVE